jgi:hypothetical protein
MDTAELKANDIHRHFVDKANETSVLVIGKWLDKAKYVGRSVDYRYVMDKADLKANDIHRHFVDEANKT